VLPFGLALKLGRFRDFMAFNPAWEAQAGAAKLCTAACLTAVSAGTVAAPATIAVLPPRATPAPMKARMVHVQKVRQKRTPTPTPTPIPTPTWTPTPVPTPTWTPPPAKTVQPRGKGTFPQVAIAGGGSDG
jgi:hypothetical protein